MGNGWIQWFGCACGIGQVLLLAVNSITGEEEFDHRPEGREVLLVANLGLQRHCGCMRFHVRLEKVHWVEYAFS